MPRIATDGATYREIAQALTDRGIKTPRGGDAWSPVTVMRAMKQLGIAAEKERQTSKQHP